MLYLPLPESVLINAGKDALAVNGVELTVTRTDTGEVLYQNTFVTDFPLTGALSPQLFKQAV